MLWSSVFSTVALIGGTVQKSNQLISNHRLVLKESEKPEYPEKNILKQSREPTNSTHIHDTESGNGTWNTMVGGQCSHHYTIPSSKEKNKK